MRKEYTDNLLFDNLEEAEAEQLSAFSMEVCIRNAAQRMIQAALEAEVAEFLQRAKYDKTSDDNFRRLSAMDITWSARFRRRSEA